MLTGLYAGILALVFVALSFNVILRRVKSKTLFGDNNDPGLTRAVRIHGNFAEYVPFAVAMMFMYEYGSGSLQVLHLLGVLLILGRGLHIFGLWKPQPIGRIAGTAITQLVLVMLAVMLIVKGYRYLDAINRTMTIS